MATFFSFLSEWEGRKFWMPKRWIIRTGKSVISWRNDVLLRSLLLPLHVVSFVCVGGSTTHPLVVRVCVGGDIHYVLHCIYVAICFWPSRVVSSDGRRRRGIKEKRNSRKAEELKRHNVQRPLAQRPGLMMDGQARLAFDGRFLLSTCPDIHTPSPALPSAEFAPLRSLQSCNSPEQKPVDFTPGSDSTSDSISFRSAGTLKKKKKNSFFSFFLLSVRFTSSRTQSRRLNVCSTCAGHLVFSRE